MFDKGQHVAERDCYLMCGHTFARVNIEGHLNLKGKILPAIPGTQPFLPLKCAAAFPMGRTHGWYAPCPTCRHLFGECEIKTLFPTS